MQNMKKTLLNEMLVSLFFHKMDIIWCQILPQNPHTEDSINIDSLCCNPVVLKKILVKFWPMHKKGVLHMAHGQNEKQFFFAEITKADHQPFRNFILSKYHMFWLS